MRYSVRYVHKIATQAYDSADSRSFEPHQLADAKAIGKAFRESRLLCKGDRVAAYRFEPGQLVVFPAASIWHAIILTPEELQG